MALGSKRRTGRPGSPWTATRAAGAVVVGAITVSVVVEQVANAEEPHDLGIMYVQPLGTTEPTSLTGGAEEPSDLSLQAGGITFVVAGEEHSPEPIRRSPTLGTVALLGAERSEAERPTPMASPSPTTGPRRRARPLSIRLPKPPEFRSRVWRPGRR